MASLECGAATDEPLFVAREDLKAEHIGDKLVVEDPVRHTFAQLGVAEYIVFRSFDGRSTVQAISERLKAEREIVVSPANVARLRDRLHAKQLLLAPGEVVTAAPADDEAKPHGVAGLVMIDLGIGFDPDPMLTRLYHRTKHIVFRPGFFIALVGLVALATSVWVQSWDAIRAQAGELGPSRSWVLYYVCLSASIFTHELAHGLVTKGFGGRVPRMGTFLYFFLFVFYTDVSASWMFKSKLRRLLVLFAGAIANLALCALATLVWRLSAPGSTVNSIAFALMAINAVAASFTLFPLLRGDGYYIVSTAFDLPNLRQNSYAYLRAAIRRRFVDRTTPLPKATDREALFYLWYAPLQIAFYITFFTYIVVHTASWLIDEIELLGFVIIIVVLIDRLGRPLLRIVPGTLDLVSDALRARGSRAVARVLVRPFGDAARWLVRVWRLALILAAPVVVLAIVPYPLSVSARFEVISTTPVHVRTRTAGIVERYLVQPGQLVRAGDVLAELVDEDLRLDREVAAAEVDQARAELAQLEAGSRREDVIQAAIGVRAERSVANLEQTELRRMSNLVRAEAASRAELDTAKADYQIARARQREATAEYAMVARGARVEERDAATASLAKSERELAWIDQQLAWTKIRAVADGRVITPVQELEQRLGKLVAVGDSVIEVVAPDKLVARIAVPEPAIRDVSADSPVTLRFFQAPDTAYSARVDGIEQRLAERVVGVYSRLTGREMTLGATGIAKIDAGSHSILGTLARRVYRSVWVVFWSWW